MALEKFHFTAEDGTKIVAPFMKDALRRKEIRNINKQYKDDQGELEDALLVKALDEKTYGQVDELTLRDYERFAAGWIERNDEESPTVGES